MFSMHDLLTLPEASKLYGYDRTTLFRWIKAGRIQGIEEKKGSRSVWKVSRPSLEALKSPSSDGSILELTELWINEQSSGIHNGKPIGKLAIRNNRNGIKNYWEFLKKPPAIREITPENFRQVLSSFPVDYEAKTDSYATKEGIFKAIISFTIFLIRRGLKTKADLEEMRKLKPRRVFPPRKTVLQENQLQAMIGANQAWRSGRSAYDIYLNEILIHLFAFAGLRRAEAVALELGHLDLENQILHVVDGKGHKNREVGICLELKGQIEQWLEYYRPKQENRYLLIQESGRQLTAEVVNHRIHALAKHSKLDITPHGLRRTFATLMENRGMPWSLMKETLGHSDIKTTQGYVMSTQRQAVEWLKNLGGEQKPKTKAEILGERLLSRAGK